MAKFSLCTTAFHNKELTRVKYYHYYNQMGKGGRLNNGNRPLCQILGAAYSQKYLRLKKIMHVYGIYVSEVKLLWQN